MKVVFAAQTPKYSAYPNDCEDWHNSNPSLGSVAISDGASESFDSQTWARILVEKFVNEPKINEKWLREAITAYHSFFDRSSMSWAKQVAYERGSFATLLGIEESADKKSVTVTAIGDSIAVVLNGDSGVETFPYNNSADFKRSPVLLSTNNALNQFFYTDRKLDRFQKVWQIHEDAQLIILCMTDALGEWALRNAEVGDTVWHTLAAIKSIDAFNDLVYRERELKRMRVDDTTLVVVSFVSSKYDELSVPRAV